MVTLERLLPAADQEVQVERALWHRGQCDETQLRKLIEDHHKWTGSLRAREILDHWADSRARFVKVFPNEYRRALGELHAQREAGETIAKARAPGPVSGAFVPAK
jgi:glutamate synthase domain-containing protein 3